MRRPADTGDGGAGRHGGASYQNVPDPAPGLPLERAEAMLPEDLLQGDEVIILLLKPSLWYIVLAPLGTLASIVALAAAALWIREPLGLHYHPNEVMALAGALLALRIFWQLLQWLSRTYVLTDRRVIRIKGFFRVVVFQAELKRVQHTDLLFSIRERLFGLGTVAFSTAGTGYPEAYWVMIRQPLAVHRRILQAIHRYRR